MNFNLKKDHLVPIYLQKPTNATQRPVLSFLYNPGLAAKYCWRCFFLEGNKEEKKKPCSLFTLSLLKVPLKSITEANGSLACINHSNIHRWFLSKPHPTHCRELPAFTHSMLSFKTWMERSLLPSLQYPVSSFHLSSPLHRTIVASRFLT